MDKPANPANPFDIEDPVANPMVFIPESSELNWGTEPMPPPTASYKRKMEDIPDTDRGVTSDWNFVLPQ